MTISESWKCIDKLPRYNEADWATLKNGVVTKTNILELTAVADKWMPANTMLIGKPGAHQFLPPICIDIFRSNILKNIARNSRNVIFMFLLSALSIFIFGIVNNDIASIYFAIPLLLMTVAFSVDFHVGLRDEVGVLERALFFYSIKTRRWGRIGFMAWLLIVLMSGASQILMQELLGGQSAAFHAYGVMYPDVHNGQVWRLITGPFLHYSVTHYVINAVLLLFIGPISWMIIGPASIIIFLFGNAVGAYAQFAWGAQLFDNYGGISAGVYALFGFAVFANSINRQLLPKGFGFLCAGLALVGIVSSEIISANSASVAHVAGFLVGLSGLAFALWHKQKGISKTPS